MITPGSERMLPTVVTPSLRMPTSRIASAAVDAAASVSRRRCIGVEPACAAWPLNWIRNRASPNVPLTADARRPVSSSTGPCSMCSSK